MAQQQKSPTQIKKLKKANKSKKVETNDQKLGRQHGYLYNVGRSVVYAGMEKMKNMNPVLSEFSESNNELFKIIYKSAIDYRTTYKRGVDFIKASKLYEAADIGLTSLKEDIKTGNLYNKERMSKLEEKAMGIGDDDNFMMDMGGFEGTDVNFDDWGDDDFADFNWDDEDDSSSDSSSEESSQSAVETLATIDSIEGSSKANANAISSAVVRSAEYTAEVDIRNTNLLYTHNVQAFGKMNSHLDALNSNMGSLLQYMDKNLSTHLSNSTEFFDQTSKALQDQVALLREIAENTRKIEAKQDDQNGEKKDQLDYGNIVDASGTPDLMEYAKKIKKNATSYINEATGGTFSMMNQGVSDESNMWAMFAANPYGMLLSSALDRLTPKDLEKAVKDLNQSVGGLFGSMITKLNTMSNDEDSPLNRAIGRVFGIKNHMKTDINTSKYNKDKVDWDGKAHKALTEVIPGLLSKQLSAMTGAQEVTFNYETGKFVTYSDLQNSFDRMAESFQKNSASEPMNYMRQMVKENLAFNSKQEHDEFLESIEKIFKESYKKGEIVNFNSKNFKNKYSDIAHEDTLMAIQALGRELPKNIMIQYNNTLQEEIARQTKRFEEEEKKGTYNPLFNGSDPNEYVDEIYDKKKRKWVKNKKKKKTQFNTNLLLDTKDKFGRNIFNYLQNIYKELNYMRRFSVGNVGGEFGPFEAKQDYEIFDVNGNVIKYTIDNTYKNATKNTIKDNRSESEKITDYDKEQQQRERDEKKFLQDQKKRIKDKKENLININDLEEGNIRDNIRMTIQANKNTKKTMEEGPKKETEFDKLKKELNLKTDKSSKFGKFFEKIQENYKSPTDIAVNMLQSVDTHLYELIYGKEDAEERDIKGIIDHLMFEMHKSFNHFREFMDEKILNPIKDRLGIDKDKSLVKGLIEYFGLDEKAKGFKDQIKEIFGTVKDNVVEVLKGVGQDVFGVVKGVFSPFGSFFDKSNRNFFDKKKKEGKEDESEEEDDDNTPQSRQRTLEEIQRGYEEDRYKNADLKEKSQIGEQQFIRGLENQKKGKNTRHSIEDTKNRIKQLNEETDNLNYIRQNKKYMSYFDQIEISRNRIEKQNDQIAEEIKELEKQIQELSYRNKYNKGAVLTQDQQKEYEKARAELSNRKKEIEKNNKKLEKIDAESDDLKLKYQDFKRVFENDLGIDIDKETRDYDLKRKEIVWNNLDSRDLKIGAERFYTNRLDYIGSDEFKKLPLEQQRYYIENMDKTEREQDIVKRLKELDQKQSEYEKLNGRKFGESKHIFDTKTVTDKDGNEKEIKVAKDKRYNFDFLLKNIEKEREKLNKELQDIQNAFQAKEFSVSKIYEINDELKKIKDETMGVNSDYDDNILENIYNNNPEVISRKNERDKYRQIIAEENIRDRFGIDLQYDKTAKEKLMDSFMNIFKSSYTNEDGEEIESYNLSNDDKEIEMILSNTIDQLFKSKDSNIKEDFENITLGDLLGTKDSALSDVREKLEKKKEQKQKLIDKGKYKNTGNSPIDKQISALEKLIQTTEKNYDKLYDFISEVWTDIDEKGTIPNVDKSRYPDRENTQVEVTSAFDRIKEEKNKEEVDHEKLSNEDRPWSDNLFYGEKGSQFFTNTKFMTESMESQVDISKRMDKTLSDILNELKGFSPEPIDATGTFKPFVTPLPRKNVFEDPMRNIQATNEQQVMKNMLNGLKDSMIRNVDSYFGRMGIRGFAKGGYIDSDQLAVVGKGEYVINDDKYTQLVEQVRNSILATSENKYDNKLHDQAKTLYQNMASILGAENVDPNIIMGMLKKSGDAGKAFNELKTENQQEQFLEVAEIVKNALEQRNEGVINSKGSFTDKGTEGGFVDVFDETFKVYKRTITKTLNSLLGEDPDKERDKSFDTMEKILQDAKVYSPDMITGALLGGGASLLTGFVGGPLLGAGVGAAIALTKNSQTIQDMLFGKQKYDKDGNAIEREGGIIPKDLVNKVSKVAPDLKKFGITGAVAGLLPLVPFGPVPGLLIGSGVAFAKNNATVQEKLFGEGGLIDKKSGEDFMKKKLPSMLAGAGLGAVASFLPFTGPFGIVGSAMIGSAMGFASTTDKFQKIVFGEYNEETKEYEGGIVPYVKKKVFEPIVDKAKSALDTFLDWAKRDILDPLVEAFKPITRQIQIMFNTVFGGIAKKVIGFFENTLVVPIREKVKAFLDVVFQPVKNLGKRLARATGKLLSLGPRMIGGIGRAAKRRQIKKGTANYMTAQERLDYMNEQEDLDFYYDRAKKEKDDSYYSLINEMNTRFGTKESMQMQSLLLLGAHGKAEDLIKKSFGDVKDKESIAVMNNMLKNVQQHKDLNGGRISFNTYGEKKQLAEKVKQRDMIEYQKYLDANPDEKISFEDFQLMTKGEEYSKYKKGYQYDNVDKTIAATSNDQINELLTQWNALGVTDKEYKKKKLDTGDQIAKILKDGGLELSRKERKIILQGLDYGNTKSSLNYLDNLMKQKGVKEANYENYNKVKEMMEEFEVMEKLRKNKDASKSDFDKKMVEIFGDEAVNRIFGDTITAQNFFNRISDEKKNRKKQGIFLSEEDVRDNDDEQKQVKNVIDSITLMNNNLVKKEDEVIKILKEIRDARTKEGYKKEKEEEKKYLDSKVYRSEQKLNPDQQKRLALFKKIDIYSLEEAPNHLRFMPLSELEDYVNTQIDVLGANYTDKSAEAEERGYENIPEFMKKMNTDQMEKYKNLRKTYEGRLNEKVNEPEKKESSPELDKKLKEILDKLNNQDSAISKIKETTNNFKDGFEEGFKEGYYKKSKPSENVGKGDQSEDTVKISKEELLEINRKERNDILEILFKQIPKHSLLQYNNSEKLNIQKGYQNIPEFMKNMTPEQRKKYDSYRSIYKSDINYKTASDRLVEMLDRVDDRLNDIINGIDEGNEEEKNTNEAIQKVVENYKENKELAEQEGYENIPEFMKNMTPKQRERYNLTKQMFQNGVNPDKEKAQSKNEEEVKSSLDAEGNEVIMKKDSKTGDYEADLTDSSTRKSVTIAQKLREKQESFYDSFNNLFKKNDEETKEEEKKGGWLTKLLGALGIGKALFGKAKGLLSGVLGKSSIGSLFTRGIFGTIGKGALVIGGLMYLPEIIDLFKNHIGPAISENWDTTIKPWLTEEALPRIKDGLSLLVKELPGLLAGTIKFIASELIPSVLRGIGWSDQNGDGEFDGKDVAHIGTNTAVRQVVKTGAKYADTVKKNVGKTLADKSMSEVGEVITKSATKEGAKEIAEGGVKASTEAVSKFGFKNVAKGAFEAVRHPFKTATKGVTTLGKTGLNGLGKTVGNLFLKVDGSVLRNSSDKFITGEVISNVADNSMINRLIKAIGDKLTKILTNEKVIRLLGNVKNTPIAKVLLDNFVTKFLKEVASRATKAGGQALARIVGGIGTGGLVSVGFAVYDFISGFNDARNILGITTEDVPLTYRIVAAIIKTLQGFSIVGTLIPTSWIVKLLVSVLSAAGMDMSNLQEQQEAAQQEVEAYNQQNGTDYTIEEYNKQVKGYKSIFGKVKDGAKWVGGKVVDGFKLAGSRISKVGSFLYNGYMGGSEVLGELGSKAVVKIGEAAQGFANVIGNLSGYLDKGVNWFKNWADNSILKPLGTVGDLLRPIVNTTADFIVHPIQTMGNLFNSAIENVKGIFEWISNLDLSTIVHKGWDKVKSFFGYSSDETNTATTTSTPKPDATLQNNILGSSSIAESYGTGDESVETTDQLMNKYKTKALNVNYTDLTSDQMSELYSEFAAKKTIKATVGTVTDKTGLIPKILQKIKSVIEYVVNSNTIVNLLGTTSSGKPVAKVIYEEFIPKFIDEVSNKLGKSSTELISSLSTKFLTRTVANWAFLISDFVNGYSNAESVLGIIDEATFMEKIIAGMIEAIKGMSLLSIVPTDIVVSFLFDALSVAGITTDIGNKREYAKTTVNTYNEKNNTSYSIEDYNKEVLGRKSIFEKIKDTASSIFSTKPNTTLQNNMLGASSIAESYGSGESDSGWDKIKLSFEKNKQSDNSLFNSDMYYGTGEELNESVDKIKEDVANSELGSNIQETVTESATDKIKSTAIDLIYKNSDKIKSTATKVLQQSSDTGTITKIINKVKSVIQSILNNKLVVNLLGQTKAGEPLAKIIYDNFVPKFMKIFTEKLTKSIPEVITRMSSKLLSAGTSVVAYAINDFISGFENAEGILGIIDKASFIEKVVAGALEAFKGLSVLSIVPSDLIITLLFDVLEIAGIDTGNIGERRSQAKATVDEYNKKNNTSYSIADYNSEVLGRQGFFSNITDNVISKAESVKEFFGFGKGEGTINGNPYYSQKEATGGLSKMISDSGCGPTATAMALSKVTGKNISPETIASDALKNGSWDSEGARGSMFRTEASKFGVKTIDAGGDFEKFDKLVSAGIPTAVSGTYGKGDSPYTSAGHIVTVFGKDKNGNYLVNDPRGEKYSKAYTKEELMNGFRNSWSFGKGEGDEVTTSDSVPELDKAMKSFTSSLNAKSLTGRLYNKTSTAMNIASNSIKNTGLIESAGKVLEEVFTKIFTNETIINLLGNAKNSNYSAASALLANFVPQVIKRLKRNCENSNGSLDRYLRAIISSGSDINDISFLISNFVSAFNNPSENLGKFDTFTIGMKVCSALMTIINKKFVIDKILTANDWMELIEKYVMPIFGESESDIKSIKTEAEKIIKQFTVKASSTEAQKQALQSILTSGTTSNTKSGSSTNSLFSKIGNTASNIVSSVGLKVKSVATSAGKVASNIASSIGSAVTGFSSWITNNIFGKGEYVGKGKNVQPASISQDQNSIIGLNNFPYYSQYGNYSEKPSLSETGCGPTSAAMVLTKVTGKNILPSEVANESYKAGFYDTNGSTSGLFSYIGDKYGVKVESVDDFSKVKEYAKQGIPMVISGKGGKLYGTNSDGHIVATFGKNKNGYLINDPSDPNNSIYNENSLRNGFKEAWIFGDKGYAKDLKDAEFVNKKPNIYNSDKDYEDYLDNIYYGKGETPTLKYVNGFPYWSQVEFGGDIMNAGCGPTAAAMVFTLTSGQTLNPKDLVKKAENKGYWTADSGVTNSKLFEYYADLYNTTATYVTNIDKVKEYAKQGYPLIVDGKYSKSSNWSKNCELTPYGPNGHYQALFGKIDDDYVMNDPRGAKYSGRRSEEQLTQGFRFAYKIGDKTYSLDPSKVKTIGSTDGIESTGITGESSSSDSASSSIETSSSDFFGDMAMAAVNFSKKLFGFELNDTTSTASTSNSYSTGGVCSRYSGTDYKAGETVKASFTAYYPDNSAMEGGYYDCTGHLLNASEQTCAAPSDVPVGTRIQISNTGTSLDGKVYTVTDRGGAIKIKSDGTYRIDILVENREVCDSFQNCQGNITFMGKDGQSIDVDEEETVGTGLKIIDDSDIFGTGENVNWGYFCDPKKGTITSYFKEKRSQYGNAQGNHGAIDYNVHYQSLYAPKSGTVYNENEHSSYGNDLTIKTNSGDTYYRLAHMKSKAVKKGDTVKQGQYLGQSGATGHVTGPHVHFEILKGGTSKYSNGVDPLDYYDTEKYNSGTIVKLKDSDLSFNDYMDKIGSDIIEVNEDGTTTNTSTTDTTTTDNSTTSTASDFFSDMATAAVNFSKKLFGFELNDTISTATTTTSSSNTGTMSGNNVAEQIFNYSKSKGCTDQSASALVGNAYCESNFESDLVNSIGASGLFQWLGGRFDTLEEKAKAAGTNWTDVKTQLDYLWWELEGGEPTTVSLMNKRVGGLEGWKTLTDAYKAGYEFGKCFERGDYYEKRGNVSKDIYNNHVQNGQLVNMDSYDYTGKGEIPSDKEIDKVLYGTGDQVKLASKVIEYALSFLNKGFTYSSEHRKYINEGKNASDCSNYTHHVYDRTTGIDIGSSTEKQYLSEKGENVNKEDLVPSDIVLFKKTRSWQTGRTNYKDGVSHAGIYLGNNAFIECSQDDNGDGIRINDLSSNWSNEHWLIGRRFIDPDKMVDAKVNNPNKLTNFTSATGSYTIPEKNNNDWETKKVPDGSSSTTVDSTTSSTATDFFSDMAMAAVNFSKKLFGFELESPVTTTNTASTSTSDSSSINITASDSEFDNAVHMGDSITDSLASANVIPRERVVATIGHSAVQGKSNVSKVVKKNPPMVIMNYGTNDGEYINSDGWTESHLVKWFKEGYGGLIDKVKEGLPNAKIVLNQIWDSNKQSIQKGVKMLQPVMSEIASSHGASLVDCRSINSEKDYHASDGVHFNPPFQKLWVEALRNKLVSQGTGDDINSIYKDIDSYFETTLDGVKSSDFGVRDDEFHTGVDYAAEENTPIMSPVSGKVVENTKDDKYGFGNTLVIRDNKGTDHRFAHMRDQSRYGLGSKIRRDDIIGNVGSTGRSTGSHLHYEVSNKKGVSINPNKYHESIGGSKNSLDNVTLSFPDSNQKIDANLNLGKGTTKSIDEETLFRLINIIASVLSKISDNTENIEKIVELLTEIQSSVKKDNKKSTTNSKIVNKNTSDTEKTKTQKLFSTLQKGLNSNNFDVTNTQAILDILEQLATE